MNKEQTQTQTQKQTQNQALHSDFQPQRFIFVEKFETNQKGIPSLTSFLQIFKNEMNCGCNDNLLNNNMLATLDAIQAELNNISSIDFETPEGFNKFMAYFIVLKQARSAILSMQKDSNFLLKNNLYKSTCTPVKYLFSGCNIHQKKNRNENNDEDEIKFKKIIKRLVNNLHYDQKYINGYYAPVLIFNDSDTSYKYKSFWKEYVKELSQKIYLVFIYKAILRFQTNTESKKIKFNINLSENQEDITNDETQNSDNEKTYEENDNSEYQSKESETEYEESEPGFAKDDEKTKNDDDKNEPSFAKDNEANNDNKSKLPSDKEEHEEDKSNKEANKEPEVSESHKATKDDKKEKISPKKTPQNNISINLTIKTQEVDPDFLDFSPILSETSMALKNNSNKREVSYKIMNLSNDISKKLIEFFENDLVKISKMVNIHEDLFVFEIASCFMEILKIMNALLYESGAEIPPLSFIWKSYDGFKLNFRNNVFTFINNYIIQQNIPYNFSTHSFATKKDLMKILSHLKNYDTYSIFSRFDDIHDCISNRYQDFGIDAVSSIASLIGKKQMISIVQELIQQLEIKAQEFCDYYAEFIANFNFKVDLSNESQNFYALKEYFDSFITFFNLSNAKNVITYISEIGNIIALLILFDSAIACEFNAKDMISASIASVVKTKNKNGEDSPFTMYLSNPDFSYQRHDFFSDAIKALYKILNNSNTRLNFDEINGHSGFYQFAIPLIYASSHENIPTSASKQNQSQNNELPKNPLINSSDSISIACSIILEVLSQYDLYGYSNVLRAFLLFDENNSDNFDISNDINSDYNNNPYKLKLNNNLQIVDIFHYTLAKFSFPAPNHIFVFKNLSNFKFSCENIIELLLHRCNQVAVLFVFQKMSSAELVNIKKCELAVITNCKQIEISHKRYISIYSKKEKEKNSYITTDTLEIFNDESEEAFLQYDDIDSLISTIRSISHQKYGDFALLIFQKKRPFSEKIKIDIHFLKRLREHFPYVIKDENYITPKKGRNPMPFKSSMSNFDIKRK